MSNFLAFTALPFPKSASGTLRAGVNDALFEAPTHSKVLKQCSYILSSPADGKTDEEVEQVEALPCAVVLRKVPFRAGGHSGSRYPRSISARSHWATAGCLQRACEEQSGEVIEEVRGRAHGDVGYGEREGG